MKREQETFPYIAHLLNGAEVEWKPLGEVAELKRGTSITKKTSNEGEIPVISGGQQPAYYIDQFNREGKTITVAGSGAYAGHVMYWEEPIFVGDAFSVKTDETILSTKYVYHFLLKNQQKIYAMKKGSGVPHVYPKDLGVLEIPVPPLSVQQEIVRILDKFTQLEAELKAELETELKCRKQQYEYYRDKLLTSDEKQVEWKKLGEVMDVYTGGEAPKNLIRGEKPEGNFIYPIYSNGEEIYGFTDSYRIEKDAVTISSIGAKTGTIYFRKAYFTPIIRLKVLVPKNKQILNSRYVFHYLSNIPIITKKSSVPNINANEVKRIQIPIPPIEEQERIAGILDKFDTLVNSISEGLPREIELRRKQYEYYREKLLSFPTEEK